MDESKIELTERLRREGRWSEASKRKDEIIKQLRSEGMKRSEAGEEAWRRIAIEYPPLPGAAAEEPPMDDGTTEVVEPYTGLPPYPESWGVIPESAPFDVEVDWVHQNRVLVVEERSGGASRIYWERARKPAPSYGALGLMEFSASNRKGFMDILQRTKPALKEEDEENTRREKKSIAEINGILKQVQERRDEELLADVPRVVQDRVRAILSDWGRRFSLTVPEDAGAALEANVAGLVQEYLNAVAKVGEREERTAHIREVIEEIGERG